MRIKTTIIVMMLLMVGSIAFGADIDGKWAGKYDSGMPGEPMTMEYTFKADGNTLTGTNNSAGSQIPIKNGKIDGNKISFTIAIDMMGNEMVFDYTGEISGDQIKMKFSTSSGSGGEFTVSRAK